MSQSSFGALDDQEAQSAESALWRRAVTTALHLGAASMAAVAAGLYVFPLY